MIYGNFFSDLGSGKSSENDQLTGHFQSFIFNFFFRVFFLKISRKNSKTSIKGIPEVCTKSLNIHNFSKNLDRTITFNSVTLKKYTDRTSKYIEDIQIFVMNMPFISSSEAKNTYFMSGEFSTFRKITVGGCVNQLIKKSGLMVTECKCPKNILTTAKA